MNQASDLSDLVNELVQVMEQNKNNRDRRALRFHKDSMIRMEVASSRSDHLPTLSAAKTSKLSLLVKLPFGGGAADASNATPTFCFSVPAISKLTTLTVESLWTAPTETAKHNI